MSNYSGILVFVGLTSQSEPDIEKVSLELIGVAKELSQKLQNKEVSVVLPMGEGDYSSYVDELQKAGVSKIYVVKDKKLAKYSSEFYSKAVRTVIEKVKPEIVLIGATANGRDMAPRVSAYLKTGLTADCTALDINEEGKLAATRPTFGGGLMATILCKNNPQMATVRPSVFKVPKENLENKAVVEEVKIDFENDESVVEFLEFIQKTKEDAGIEDASVLVCAGGAVKNQDDLKVVENLADALGGKLCATRYLVAKNLCPHSIQVGQTGKTVSPNIYIACGVSGAIHHVEGMKTSGVIIAINKDKNANIFKVADYGIVADMYEVIPKLIEKIKNK